MATLGEKVRVLRRQRGLSQVQLAQALSMSRSALAGIESPSRARDVPSLEVALRIAYYFGVPADQLLRPEIEVEALPVTSEVYNLQGFAALTRFGEKLRRLRTSRHMSLEELRQELDASYQHYRHLETGERYPSTELVLRIADYFGVPTDTLVFDALDLPQQESPQPLT